MNVNEYGIQFVFGVSFDMTANTSLSLTFTKPSGETLTVSNPSVTISGSSYPDGPFAANTYFLYTFVSGNVDEAGDWSVRGIYNASGPVHLISEVGYFTVGT